MSNNPPIAILILNWNNFPDTSKCLDSLNILSYDNYQVCLIDNGSEDGSLGLLKAQYPDITYIELAKNKGFSGGNNAGIKYSLDQKYPYILLLNNDTEIIRGDFLQLIVNEIQHTDDICAVGPNVIQLNGNPDHTILPYPSLLSTIRNTLGLYRPNFVSKQTVDSVSGCCVLVNTKTIRQVGFLDENFFMYAEETEWFYRMRKAGWKVIYLPVKSVVHKGGSSAKRLESQEVYIERRANVIYTLVKHQQKIQATFTSIFMLILLTLRILASVIRINPNERFPLSMVLELIAAIHLKWSLAASIGINRGNIV